MQYKKGLPLIFLALTTLSGLAQRSPVKEPINWQKAMHSEWVNSHINQLSLDEMIAQLFWVAVPAHTGVEKLAPTINMIKRYHPGGVIFFKNTPTNVAKATNELQKNTSIPLIMSIDGEWGLGMRLQNSISYPFQMTLGAIQTDQLIEEMGYEIGQQFKRIGIHVNLAPVADINTNPNNPVIGRRSFGADPQQVAKKTTYYMLGMQRAGIAAVALSRSWRHQWRLAQTAACMPPHQGQDGLDRTCPLQNTSQGRHHGYHEWTFGSSCS